MAGNGTVLERPLIVLSGCSGGGKSTLLEELGRRGYRTFEEPGRRIVRDQTAAGGTALPWKDTDAFLALCFAEALKPFAEVGPGDAFAFCDRSLIEPVSHYEHSGVVPAAMAEAVATHRYHRVVFMTPPWKEIFKADTERKHGFDEASAEYERLLVTFPRHGYECVILPKRPPGERADFVIERLRRHAATENPG